MIIINDLRQEIYVFGSVGWFFPFLSSSYNYNWNYLTILFLVLKLLFSQPICQHIGAISLT